MQLIGSGKKMKEFAPKNNFDYLKLNVGHGFSGERGAGIEMPPPKRVPKEPDPVK